MHDRAYIYWHLLEIDPDIAKEMIYSANVSACYFKKDRDIINEEDMVVDEEARKEKEEKEKKKRRKRKEGKKRRKKEKKERYLRRIN